MQTYDYDGRGLLMTYHDKRNKVSTAIYDSATGNLETITDPLGAVTTIGRDDAGHVTSVTEATGAAEERTTTVEYDAMNRLEVFTDGSARTFLAEYDAAGNLEEVTLPTGSRHLPVHESSGLLSLRTLDDASPRSAGT